MATQQELSALEAAVAAGVLTVEVEGRRTTFADIGSLLRRIDYVKRKLAEQSAEGYVTQSFASFSRD